MSKKNKTIHFFGWDTQSIIDNLDDIEASGWNSILTSPVQPSKEEDNWTSWYMNYQITSLSIGNKHGNKNQLTELCNKAHEKGILVYTDIIITHFANKSKEEELTVHENVDKNLVNNPYFWREKKYIDYDNRYSITHHCNGLPAIRTENYDYQNLVINFLNELIDCGIDGVRIDSAKMIATPEEDFGEAKNEFFKNVLEGIKKPIFIFGEVIFEKNKELIEKYQKYINVLTELNENSYNLNKEKTMVFIESHDSYLDENIGYSSGWKTERIVNNYEFLARDFQKVLFYARPFNDAWKSERIKQINIANTYI